MAYLESLYNQRKGSAHRQSATCLLFLLLEAILRSFLCFTNCLNCCSFCLMRCINWPICSWRFLTSNCYCWISSFTVSWFWKNLVLLCSRNWEAVSDE